MAGTETVRCLSFKLFGMRCVSVCRWFSGTQLKITQHARFGVLEWSPKTLPQTHGGSSYEQSFTSHFASGRGPRISGLRANFVYARSVHPPCAIANHAVHRQHERDWQTAA